MSVSDTTAATMRCHACRGIILSTIGFITDGIYQWHPECHPESGNRHAKLVAAARDAERVLKGITGSHNRPTFSGKPADKLCGCRACAAYAALRALLEGEET